MPGEDAGYLRPEWLRIAPRRRATAWPGYAHGADQAGLAPTARTGAPPPSFGPLTAGTLYRLVLGVDEEPVPMPADSIAALGDPFAAALLKARAFPLTVQDLLAGLDAAKAVTEQAVYMISEAGQVPPTASLERDMRFAIVRGTAPMQADLLISTSAVGDQENVFLQVAAWDGAAGIYNYYMRISGTWVWAGDSNLALAEPSRGQGCFDSHVNGSVVMKELKRPWNNWQSGAAAIQLADDDPLKQNPLYLQLGTADNLELTIRPAVARWTKARLARSTANGLFTNAPWVLRQLCTTTTVNLTSTDQESAPLIASPAGPLVLPLGFWLNTDLLLDNLPIPADPGRPTAPASLYAASIAKYQFALTEGDFRQDGDTFFAFLVPESALEDNQVVIEAVQSGLLSPHFAASVLMVDFPNPVFSARRAALLRYVPASVSLAQGRDVSGVIATAITAAAPATPDGSPEREFAANWSLPDADWPTAFANRIQSYLSAVGVRAATAAGFDDYTRLAESRRREFRQMRLFEFTLTLPTTNIPADAPLLSMNEDGTVSPKSRAHWSE
jgi:hypothetical protein